MNFHCRNHPLTRENKQLNWGQRGNLLSSKEFAPLILCCSSAKCASLIPLLLSWPAGFCQPTPLLGGPQRASAELQKPALLFLCWKKLTHYHIFQQKLVHIAKWLTPQMHYMPICKNQSKIHLKNQELNPQFMIYITVLWLTHQSQQTPRCHSNLCRAAGLYKCYQLLLEFI